MYVFHPRLHPRTATYAYLSPSQHRGAFTSDECARIRAMAGDFEKGTVAGGVVNTEYRDADVQGIPFTAETGWIFKRIADAARALNDQFWHFDVVGVTQPALQLIRYRKGQHQTWHRDGVDGTFQTRKLSISVQITPSSAFEGGELQFFDRETPTRIPPEQLEEGTIIVFPSYLVHRVTPVTKGERLALVLWIDGPPYR